MLRIDAQTGAIVGAEILAENDLPVLGDRTVGGLNRWFNDRAIPNGRQYLEEILQREGCATPAAYLVKNLALSLCDTYWICPASLRSLTWDEVNLFSHQGEELTFHDGEGRAFYTSSNASLTGSLDKSAVYRDGGWHLIKEDGGLSGEGLQNINEAFASYIHRRQGWLRYVDYSLNYDETGVPTTCECRYFTNASQELVSAFDVTGGSQGTYHGEEELHRFADICVANGLTYEHVQRFLDYQTMTDFVITNTDRHWSNWGVLRDPETCRFLSMAPIYDSGTSMFCNDPFARGRLSVLRAETNGVLRRQEEQLRLVENRVMVDITRLPSRIEAYDFYTANGVSTDRAEQIAECYALKVDMLYEFQKGYPISIANEMEHLGTPPYVNLLKNSEYKGDHCDMSDSCSDDH